MTIWGQSAIMAIRHGLRPPQRLSSKPMPASPTLPPARPLLLAPRWYPLVALAAGAISALGFAPQEWWPLTVLGVAGLVALLDVAPTRRSAMLSGWLFGFGQFAVSLTWIATAFTFQAKMPPAVGWVAVIGLSMFLALYVALAAGLARTLGAGGLARVLVLAACWMLGEWLRGWVLTGFAWNPLGAAWLGAPGVAQFAEFIGGLGLSGLMVLAGGALWLMLRPVASMAGRGAGALLALVLVATGAIGASRNTETNFFDNPSLVIIQPNIGQGEKYDPGAEEAHLQRYLDMTRDALGGKPAASLATGSGEDVLSAPGRSFITPDEAAITTGVAGIEVGEVALSEKLAISEEQAPPAIVIWSESAVFGLVEEDPALRRRLASVLGPRDLLLFGGVAANRAANGEIVTLTNSLFALDSSGKIHGRYDKAHLVPLGEYVPARALMTRIGLARLAPGDLDFAAGPGPQTLALPGLPPAGIQICYEIIFGANVIDAAKRPAWIANISNDAWFGPSGPPQHLAQARLRAIEEGLPVARATPTGISAIIDSRGNVLASQAAGTSGVLRATLPPPLPATRFARLGHGSSAILGVLLLGLGLLVSRRR